MAEIETPAVRDPEYVDYQTDAGVTIIRLNRPNRMNSLSAALVAQLDAAWNRFVADDDARVAIYTGTGRAFCAGMDVTEAAAAPSVRRFPEPPLTVFHAGKVTKPVIAAVNGFAVGGGCFDVMRTDLRIAADTAVFQLAEVKRSVLPHPLFEGIAEGLADCAVTELALGLQITAQRAYEIGLINAVVPGSELLEAAARVAQEIVQLPPLAVEAVVTGLRRMKSLRQSSREMRLWQEETTKALARSSDYHEALASFLEKRPPLYLGR